MDDATVKEKLQKIQDVSWSVLQEITNMQALSNEGLNFIRNAEENKINMTDAQKEYIITRYKALKTSVQTEWSKLP